MIPFEAIRCLHDDVVLQGSLIRPETAPRGTVMMFPGATGPVRSFQAAMRELAREGYRVIGADMYGIDADISTPEAAGQYFVALLNAPDVLRARVLAWLDTVCALPGVTAPQVAAIGYCFGGKCVLELARSGAAIAAVISYHGLLTTHAPAQAGNIPTHVSVWTGGRDPYAPVSDFDSLRAELDAAQADYQVTLFSLAQHSFTDPDHEPAKDGIAYDPLAHRVAWAGTLATLAEKIRS